MKYTINDKEYSEFDINKRCAELMGLTLFDGCVTKSKGDYWVRIIPTHNYDPCNNPSDTWPIIEKVWDELLEVGLDSNNDEIANWQFLMQHHNCSKLIAACICLIELNES